MCIRELLDNGIDFLVKSYKGAEGIAISVTIFRDDNLFYLKVRNNNPNNIPVFENKKAIFDFDQRYGSKQDLHIISRGMLGDAMKQILSFGYILIHLNDDGTSFEDRQWTRPLIIRHNKEEWELTLHFDKALQKPTVTPRCTKKDLDHTDTEIELWLPIPTGVRSSLKRDDIINFCKIYPLFTTDITFEFEITDNSSPTQSLIESDQETDEEASRRVIDIISSESPKATIQLKYKALHPISTESWNKQNSVHSYTSEEFKRRFLNVDLTQSGNVRMYDMRDSFREGSNLKKTSDLEISLPELSQLPEKERNKRIEHFYEGLKDALPTAPEKLTLPYTTNRDERKMALISRAFQLYHNLDKDVSKAAYKPIHGKVVDKKRRISYPYFFEILAIPFEDPRHTKHNMIFIGAVNYSISPKEDSNQFNGDYSPYVYGVQGYSKTENIIGVLENYGFHEYAVDTAKIPCLILANLVTPKREPHGQDKSRIDVNPFMETIVLGVKRLAGDIKSYRARGITFHDPAERYTAEVRPSGRGKLKTLLTSYLKQNHGL